MILDFSDLKSWTRSCMIDIHSYEFRFTPWTASFWMHFHLLFWHIYYHYWAEWRHLPLEVARPQLVTLAWHKRCFRFASRLSRALQDRFSAGAQFTYCNTAIEGSSFGPMFGLVDWSIQYTCKSQDAVELKHITQHLLLHWVASEQSQHRPAKDGFFVFFPYFTPSQMQCHLRTTFGIATVVQWDSCQRQAWRPLQDTKI